MTVQNFKYDSKKSYFKNPIDSLLVEYSYIGEVKGFTFMYNPFYPGEVLIKDSFKNSIFNFLNESKLAKRISFIENPTIRQRQEPYTLNITVFGYNEMTYWGPISILTLGIVPSTFEIMQNRLIVKLYKQGREIQYWQFKQNSKSWIWLFFLFGKKEYKPREGLLILPLNTVLKDIKQKNLLH